MYKVRDLEICGWSITQYPDVVEQEAICLLIAATRHAENELFSLAFDVLGVLDGEVDAVVIDPEGVYIWCDGCVLGPNTYGNWMVAHIAHVIHEESTIKAEM
jgi:hypothetical protein